MSHSDHTNAASLLTAYAPQSATVAILSACAAFSVANVYYAQPLLDTLTKEFSLTLALAGSLVTATQVGAILALAFVLPLGDLIGRKRLLAMELAMLVTTLLTVMWTDSVSVLFVAMLTLGLLGTAATQGAIAYAAALVSSADRGRIVGLVQSGVLIGVLGSRSLAGLIADLTGWRAVFGVSAALTGLTLLSTLAYLPRVPIASLTLPYSKLLLSMLELLRNEKILRLRGALGFLVFAAFGAFWSSVVLPLREAPHHMSHTAVGGLGLAGIAGALVAARAGRWADANRGGHSTALGLSAMILSWIFIAFLPNSITSLILGVVLLDMGGQAVHVTSQSMILRSNSDLHSRLVGCYMLFYASGLGLGAVCATSIYAHHGWSGVCGLGFTISSLALVFWASTRELVTQAASHGRALK